MQYINIFFYFLQKNSKNAQNNIEKMKKCGKMLSMEV